MNTNTKRLSAMIDSLHDPKDDDLLYVQRSTPVVQNTIKDLAHDDQSSMHSMSRPRTANQNGISERAFGSPNFKFGSPGNRESLISDYSASIHEGVPVYLNSKPSSPADERPVIYSAVNFPLSEETVNQGQETQASEPTKTSSGIPRAQESAANLNIMNNTTAKPAGFLKLSAPQQFHHKKSSTVGSGNLASESGHSHNISESGSSPKFSRHDQYSASYNHDYEEPRVIEQESLKTDHLFSENSNSNEPQERSLDRSWTTNSVRSTLQDGSDTQSLASSIVPSLRTNLPADRAQVILPDRSLNSDYNPSIPPRSRNRPISYQSIKNGLEDIQNQLQEQMVLDKSRSTSQASTNKSSSYFSAVDPANEFNMDHDEEDEEENLGKVDDDSYLRRPLPIVPANKNSGLPNGSIDRDQTILLSPARQQEESQPPRMPSFPTSLSRARETGISGDVDQKSNSFKCPKNNQIEDENDDDFEDILDDSFVKSDTPSASTGAKPKKKRNDAMNDQKANAHESRRGKRKSRGGKREMRSFDIDTIAQMLDVTKGTLIGSEFANLGMQTEEKRALERLVDSLSRLTADMVVDPRRFQEGMKRLDKATRALEGF
ncbi:LAME_0F05622g1_1 [Lachancea meyersii CBS 8951]|uniref:LAME_0F05622g1_1 n=1 Tax=Lachancea meyersii CBS 8951 TaxID=1266667 RepID=A0A1G4JT35_9SACH|nr:LAME_0F05622g1_1 [Lachancea meyersii CBS 8951]